MCAVGVLGRLCCGEIFLVIGSMKPLNILNLRIHLNITKIFEIRKPVLVVLCSGAGNPTGLLRALLWLLILDTLN